MEQSKKNFLERMVSTYLTPGLIIGALITGGVFWGEIKDTLFTSDQKKDILDHLEDTPTEVEVFVQGQKYIEAVHILEGVMLQVDTVQSLYNEISENQKDAIKSRKTRDSSMVEIVKSLKRTDSVQKVILKRLDHNQP